MTQVLSDLDEVMDRTRRSGRFTYDDMDTTVLAEESLEDVARELEGEIDSKRAEGLMPDDDDLIGQVSQFVPPQE